MRKKDSKTLDTSDDDFQTPIPPKIYKKLILETKPKVSDPNKNKKGPKKRQLKLRTVIEQNLHYSDVNPEHLQVALALSKSTYKEQNGVKEKDFDWSIFRRKPEITKTKTPNGFKEEYKLHTKKHEKNQKGSKFKYITPTLLMRSEDERESLIQSQLSLILSNNRNDDECHYKNSEFELFSDQLRSLRCLKCCIFIMNSNNDPHSHFKVADLNIAWERSRSGYLLKDWKQIPFRDCSPEIELPHKKSENNDEKYFQNETCVITNLTDITGDKNSNFNSMSQSSFDKGVLERFSNDKSNCVSFEKLNVIEENSDVGNENLGNKSHSLSIVDKLVENEISNSIKYAPVSPDLFDDEDDLFGSSLDSATIGSARKSLGSLFSQQTVSEVMDNTSEKVVECSKIHSETGIYHYNVFNSDSNVDFLTISSDEDETELIENKVHCLTEIEKKISTSQSKDEIIESLVSKRKSPFAKEIFGYDFEKSDVNATSAKLSFSENDNNPSSEEDLPIINTSSKKYAETEILKDLVPFISNNSTSTEKSNSFPNTSTEKKYLTDYSFRIKKDLSLEESANNVSGFVCNSRLSSSLNVTDHIEEILAKNYSNIDSLKLSDVEYEKTPDVKYSFKNKASSSSPHVSEELKILMTKADLKNNDKSTNHYNDNSSQDSEDPIYISDEELNYSSNFKLSNSKEFKLNEFENCNSSDMKRSSFKRFASFSDNYVPNNQFSIDNEIVPTVINDEIDDLGIERLNNSLDNEIEEICEENPIEVKKFHSELSRINQPDDEDEKKNRLFKKYASFTETSTPTHTPCFSRYKSEPNITPDKKVTIKTKNVTPMTNYEAMSTPEIHKELNKFGLKPLKRKRGSEFLKYIYEATHPLLKSKDSNLGSNKRRKGDKFLNSNILDDISAEEVQPSLVEESWIEKISESEWILERLRSKKKLTCPIPLQLVWHNFLAANSSIREKILLYEPLEIDFLHKSIKDLGYNFHSEDVIKFLDSKCITIRVSQNHKAAKTKDAI